MNANRQLFFNALFMCHRMPERSFFYKGKQFPICARCTGLGVGYILAFLLLAMVGLFPLWLVFACIVPMAIDGIGQLFNRWQSTNHRRFVTGLFAGIGLLYILFHIGNHAFTLGHTLGSKLLTKI